MVDDIIDALETAKEACKLLPPSLPNMKPVHFRVLNAIYRIHDDSASSRISDISKVLGFLLPNTTKLINEMVELNIVEKYTMPSDKRVVLVRTTDVGEKYLKGCVLAFRKHLQEEFSKIDESDCMTMIETINKIHKILKQIYESKMQ
ncbi:MAG: MarR family winged helix-turn-helix transcriptional regulator [Armatimonadota bacterium]